MHAAQRRDALLALLRAAEGPLSATAIAGHFSVSRQLIVGDVALLRASGVAIAATPRGYLLEREGGLLRTLACVHAAADMEAELNLMVDNGYAVLDVVVEHSLYGQLTGQLQLRSRYDVSEFIRRAADSGSRPLSDLTGGIHLHTLRCPDEAAFLRARAALDRAGFLYRDP